MQVTCGCGREWLLSPKTLARKEASSNKCVCGELLSTSFGSFGYDQVLVDKFVEIPQNLFNDDLFNRGPDESHEESYTHFRGKNG